MLKNIPSILSPELLKILMEMGHGDDLVIGDGNFPAASHTQRLVRLDGHGTADVLRAVLGLFPLDTYVESPVALMAVIPGDEVDTPIWREYEQIIKGSGEPFRRFDLLPRPEFYERARQAYAVVATGETALYSNIILKKGVL
jgi:L-fucose mutarotase